MDFRCFCRLRRFRRFPGGFVRMRGVGWEACARESKKARIARMHQEYEQLCVEIPDPKCALNFNSPFELLVATVLSAQTTDKRVNVVTPELFGEYPGPAELAAANPEHVEDIIRTIGFFQYESARSHRAVA